MAPSTAFIGQQLGHKQRHLRYFSFPVWKWIQLIRPSSIWLECQASLDNCESLPARPCQPHRPTLLSDKTTVSAHFLRRFHQPRQLLFWHPSPTRSHPRKKRMDFPTCHWCWEDFFCLINWLATRCVDCRHKSTEKKGVVSLGNPTTVSKEYVSRKREQVSALVTTDESYAIVPETNRSLTIHSSFYSCCFIEGYFPGGS